MKKIIVALFLTSLFSTTMASEKGLNDKNGAQKKTAIYHIEKSELESTIYYDGDKFIKFGIFCNKEMNVKIQIMWDNTPMMNLNYNQQSINDGVNLSQLPAGNYSIRINYGDQTIEREFVKTTAAIAIFE